MGIDIGFNALVILIFLIIPGVIFRRFYFQGEFSKQFKLHNLTLTLIFSLVLGIIIQVISFSLYRYQIEAFVLNYLNTEDSFLSNVKGIYDALIKIETECMTSESNYFFQIVIFLVYSYVVAFLCSIFVWAFVRLLKLDRAFKIFRFNNHWNYYFKGEIKDFREFKHLDKGKVLYTEADVILQTNSGDRKMYSGILSQYTIEPKTNKLENIYLTNARKWKLVENKG